MPASRFVVSMLLRSGETFLYTLKAGPAGGRLRRPSSAPRAQPATIGWRCQTQPPRLHCLRNAGLSSHSTLRQ